MRRASHRIYDEGMSDAAQERAREELRQLRFETYEHMRKIRLSKKQIDRIVNRIRSLVEIVREADRDLSQFSRRAAMSYDEVRQLADVEALDAGARGERSEGTAYPLALFDVAHREDHIETTLEQAPGDLDPEARARAGDDRGAALAAHVELSAHEAARVPPEARAIERKDDGAIEERVEHLRRAGLSRARAQADSSANGAGGGPASRCFPVRREC
jgi:hypothetical protein